MRSFWSYVSNGTVSVGCTGQTVYVYDQSGNELAKFKDMKYAYLPVISPDGKQLVVKSTEGRLAVYSLETLSLIKKFRFSKVNCAQDDGCCFSPDGSLFYNIERQGDDLHTALSIYDTETFTLKKRLLNTDDNMCIQAIEYDTASDTVYLLGFYRNENGIASRFFVAQLIENELCHVRRVSQKEHGGYVAYKDLQSMGFTRKKYEWSYMDADLETLKNGDYSLARLHREKSDRC